jgi:hypothetical protein
MSAAVTASTWTPADWIAFAGVVATACGAVATLGGVRLGARIAARDTRRRDAQTVLVAVELARFALDVEDLSTEDLVDDSLGIDRSEARMQRINKADAIKLAHDAIIALIARRNEARVTGLAYEVDARLASAQQLVAEWYAQQLHARKATDEAKDAALAKSFQLLSSARSALDELHSKTDELRQVTLGQPESPGTWTGTLGRDHGNW